MLNLFFLSDFDLEFPHHGGAEIYDQVLISELKKAGCKVKLYPLYKNRNEDFLSLIKEKDNFIISNFTLLTETEKSILKNKNYVIVEHDHKYISTRDPSNFKDYIVPKNCIIGKDFYEAAAKVYCQSSVHSDVVRKNLKISNIEYLPCSLWSDEQIEILEKNIDNKKESKVAILDSTNHIKNTRKAIQYCEENNKNYNLISGIYEEFIELLSKNEEYLFLPKVLESFSRVCVEARIVGCKVMTNKLSSCIHEDWYKQKKGRELLNYIKGIRKEIVDEIKTNFLAEQDGTKKAISDITVILNCYRRPYNLEMQIAAIKKQTKQPKQIWLWVNQHEDNEGFDYSQLDVDRLFLNNYNWKFYGRFAAALLADTEYIAIFDDDTVPGKKWFENCFKTMSVKEGILGSAGVILKSDKYADHDRCGWPTHNDKIERVDLVGHAWFFKRQWLQYLWKEKPPTWDNGEDIQFSYSAQKYGGVETYCPPHPTEDKDMHGSILGNELGIDSKATSTDSAVSHQQFFSERDGCVQYSLKSGWKTVKGIKT
tara:strand:+ start:2637 stop:4253 length:1617 start_codon:yes stop_codon:yes gene_type:complete